MTALNNGFLIELGKYQCSSGKHMAENIEEVVGKRPMEEMDRWSAVIAKGLASLVFRIAPIPTQSCYGRMGS